MKNTLMMMLFALVFLSCDDSKKAEQMEIKNEIETTDSINLEIDKAQEELEESIDALDDILNEL